MTTQTSKESRPIQFDTAPSEAMTSMSARERSAVRRRQDRREYWVLFGLCLVFFLVAASIAWLIRAVFFRHVAPPHSIWAEAREEASLCAASAFLG